MTMVIIHSKVKGSIGETAIALDLMKQGCYVFKEVGDNSRVDIIALQDKKPIKIQVKSLTSVDGKVLLKNTKSGPNGMYYKYDSTDVDVFAVYVLDTEDIFYVSSAELCKMKRQMTFRLNPTKNGQKVDIHMIESYRSFKGASETKRRASLVEDDIVQTTTLEIRASEN
jgi:hypothetical protein